MVAHVIQLVLVVYVRVLLDIPVNYVKLFNQQVCESFIIWDF